MNDPSRPLALVTGASSIAPAEALAEMHRREAAPGTAPAEKARQAEQQHAGVGQPSASAAATAQPLMAPITPASPATTERVPAWRDATP